MSSHWLSVSSVACSNGIPPKTYVLKEECDKWTVHFDVNNAIIKLNIIIKKGGSFQPSPRQPTPPSPPGP